MTESEASKLPHGTIVYWTRKEEEDLGQLFHEINYSYILWSDGQKTFTRDDAAMKFVIKKR